MMDERVKKLFEEYRHSDRKRRIDMWLIFPEARENFTEIEWSDKNPIRKFGVDPCQICCGR